ncbi:hypothetical protein ACFV6E_36995 [Streptomyces sp. NPDC059785]|uniref:hypothetical protein n=1 Tax=unclassified Streptomyces TaxID=2593676 RepID=UPI003652B4C3
MEQLIQAAVRAPSGGSMQGREGMDEVVCGRLAAAVEYRRDHFADTPALVVPCYRIPESRIAPDGPETRAGGPVRAGAAPAGGRGRALGPLVGRTVVAFSSRCAGGTGC